MSARGERVLVALSGGVDSAVAAALLVEAGHDVTAVHLRLADTAPDVVGQGCCGLDDAQDALGRHGDDGDFRCP